MLAEFRQRYPQGSLVGELVDIDRGTYIVRVSIQVENIILATGLAAADRVETAEDAARERAIAALVLDGQTIAEPDNSTAVKERTKSNPKAIANPSLVTPVKVDPVPPKTSLNNGSTANNNLVGTTASSEILEPKSEPSSQVTPEPTIEPEILEQPVISEPPIPLEETTVESSSGNNLFAGTQASKETVEQLLADGANITASDSSSTAVLDSDAKIKFTEMKHKTDLEIKRLGWTKDDGQDFLKSRYGKRSRLQLTDEQLWEFLQYLEAQPNPS